MFAESGAWRLLVLIDPANEGAAAPLAAARANWQVDIQVPESVSSDAARPDLLLLLLPPTTPSLSEWLTRFRLQCPDCPVFLVERPEEERAWYQAAIRLGVDDLLALPPDAEGWRRVLDEAAEALATGEEQSRLLGRLERGGKQLEQSRRHLAETLIKAYENLGQTHRQLSRRLDQLSTLYELGRDLGIEANWDRALDRFLNTCVKSLEFRSVALLLWSFYGQRLAARASLLMDKSLLETAITRLKALASSQRSRTEMLAMAGGELLVRDALSDDPAGAEMLLLPLVHGGEAQGYLAYRKPYASGAALAADDHFLKTVQTLLGEELANGKNVQRLRRLEKFNRTVLESIRASVLTLDGENRVSYFNPQAASLLGERVCLGGTLPLDEDFRFSDGDASEPGERDWIHRECRLLGADGREERHLLVSTTCLPVRHPSQTRTVMVCEDLTEYRALQRELQRMEHLSSLGQLSAGMAHEIRNPLAGIAMTAQVLRSKLADREETLPFLDRIQQETERLERIVRGLLDYSRPASPQRMEVDLREVAQRALTDMAGRAAAEGVALEWPEPGPPLPAHADRDQLHQVLLNLLINALQACAGGERVGLRLERVAVAGGGATRLRMVVHDSGPGVTPEAEKHLFDPFFTTKAEGTGLGLSVCQKIMDEHGGRIRYQPRTGGGAEFVLEIAPAHAAGSPSEES